MTKEAVYKVRGIYYDPSKGLFLIESEKSKLNNRLTTPGGKVNEGESFSDGLARLITEETGTQILRIDYSPFFSERYFVDREQYKTLAYGIVISTRSLTGEKKGLTPNGTRFVFMPLKELLDSGKRLTMSTKQIVSSKEFVDFIARK